MARWLIPLTRLAHWKRHWLSSKDWSLGEESQLFYVIADYVNGENRPEQQTNNDVRWLFLCSTKERILLCIKLTLKKQLCYISSQQRRDKNGYSHCVQNNIDSSLLLLEFYESGKGAAWTMTVDKLILFKDIFAHLTCEWSKK